MPGSMQDSSTDLQDQLLMEIGMRDAVHYIDAEECSYPLCVHLLSPSAFIRVPNSGPEFATADKRRWETRMDADGFKEFPPHLFNRLPNAPDRRFAHGVGEPPSRAGHGRGLGVHNVLAIPFPWIGSGLAGNKEKP
jgi:hypothetical protein